MKFKGIVSDLDGTLLDGEHKISQRTKEVISKVRQRGKKVFIATGRHPLDSLQIKKELGLKSYLISSNGAVIHNENNEIVYKKSMSQKSVDFILSLSHSKDITRHIYTLGHWYVEEEKEEFKKYQNGDHFVYTLANFEDIHSKKIDEEIIKIFFISENVEELLKIEEEVKEKLGDEVTVTLSFPQCLEFMGGDVSKGNAIKDVSARLGINLEELIAFGDGLNDYEMLTLVGKGIMMGNSCSRLRDKFKTGEVIENNIDDGVAKYLEKILLETEE